MDKHGFYRVAAAVPRVCLADPKANAERTLELLKQAATQGCELVVFPELGLTGYTCGDLFQQDTLLHAAFEQLEWITERSTDFFDGLAIVGLPIRLSGKLYNAAAIIQHGSVRGLVPKQALPNYKEFYECRWFEPGTRACEDLVIQVRGEWVPLSNNHLFADLRAAAPRPLELVIGVEICEDLWLPIPPSSHMAKAGATVLVNLSASNELTTKADYRRELVLNQSARCLAAYIYASCGVHESTTDLVYSGHALIAENGLLLAESKRFAREDTLIVADIDIQRLLHDRAGMNTFSHDQRTQPSYEHIAIEAGAASKDRLHRPIPAHPFVPTASHRLRDRCEEIFHIQTAALAARIETVRPPVLSIGVSGGLDSTLALLVAVRTCDLLDLPRTMVHATTMPGFGTTDHTKSNAEALMRHLAVTSDHIDIRQLCLDTFLAIGHHPFGIDPTGMTLEQFVQAISNLPKERASDLVFENVQARVRTMLLMNRGFVIGTGDLSELALGWATYNADHMSMYNPNVSIPKTLVRFLVEWVADNEFTGPASDVLHSIAQTKISPELLPVDSDGAMQSTEATIGPYELHDFFLFHVLRFGFTPEKILRLAGQARFERTYTPDEIRHWLKTFYRRFFHSQFKRSCLPDGPKVGSVSLSPRGDWRMPSDANVAAWIRELET